MKHRTTWSSIPGQNMSPTIQTRPMVFMQYYPLNKVTAIQMKLQGNSHNSIQQSLGKQISEKSFNQWVLLYQHTQRVLLNPYKYKALEQPRNLKSDYHEFMIQLNGKMSLVHYSAWKTFTITLIKLLITLKKAMELYPTNLLIFKDDPLRIFSQSEWGTPSRRSQALVLTDDTKYGHMPLSLQKKTCSTACS
ncbi:hypothetical protein VP01_362g22 [Puccinia sorghi]|uniref:Uncharacterized protein n=1 Tax=Puccinia sorghi TaxID=27349 RepID=A0A0L6UWN9_9BASI|nr:hypothetical protein VP01_362g22 [Puccinia sorghi]